MISFADVRGFEEAIGIQDSWAREELNRWKSNYHTEFIKSKVEAFVVGLLTSLPQMFHPWEHDRLSLQQSTLGSK